MKYLILVVYLITLVQSMALPFNASPIVVRARSIRSDEDSHIRSTLNPIPDQGGMMSAPRPSSSRERGRSDSPRPSIPQERGRSNSPRTRAHAQAEEAAFKARNRYWDTREKYLQERKNVYSKYKHYPPASSDSLRSKTDLLKQMDGVISAKDTHLNALKSAQQTAAGAGKLDRGHRNSLKVDNAQRTLDVLRAEKLLREMQLKRVETEAMSDDTHMWKGTDHPDTKAANQKYVQAWNRNWAAGRDWDIQDSRRWWARARLNQDKRGRGSDSSEDETDPHRY